jgi:hypothetical protein
MLQELPFKRKSEPQHISELLPAAMERIVERTYNPIPDPNDVEASIRWVEENL